MKIYRCPTSLLYLFIFLASCGSDKGNISNSMYVATGGHKNLYVVDTFNIINPIRVITTEDIQFIMPREVFDKYNGDKKFFFEQEDIFLLVDRLPNNASYKELKEKGYKISSLCYEYNEKISINKKNISSVYEYVKAPDYFILALIQGDYYNSIYAGIDGFSTIKIPYRFFSYCKIAIPVCLNEE